MKFLYVDVKDRKLVAVFQNNKGENLYWDRAEVLEQKKKHEILSSHKMIQHCEDALQDLDIAKKNKKPWWKFW